MNFHIINEIDKIFAKAGTAANISALHQAEELKAAYERIDRLEADLNECLEYFEDRYDVVDGSYGEPAPNKEMQLGSMIQETLHGPGAF